ncbi:MAG: OmpA family protein [bacterium]
MDRRTFFLLFVGLTLLICAPPAFAEGSVFSYKLKNLAQTDTGAPAFILRANEPLTDVDVVMTRNDGKEVREHLATMKPGKDWNIPFKSDKGSFVYQIRITATAQGDQSVDASFSTEVHYLDPIKLEIQKDSVRLAEGELLLNTNVALEKVDIEVLSKSGKKIVNTTNVIGGSDGNIKVSWPAIAQDIGAIKITATDVAGFWSKVRLDPFFVEIPHEDVVFDTGKSTWQASEEAKLVATAKQIRAALRKHKDGGLDVSIYVAGYTDTVGDAESNIALSEARARAIGEWFRKQNLNANVYIQGFGEAVLAVQTGESVDEPRNRRAVYILGNSPPPTSAQIPRADWKRL